MNPIYPAHCVPCLAKRECQSLPLSNNCDLLRRVEPAECFIPVERMTKAEIQKEAHGEGA